MKKTTAVLMGLGLMFISSNAFAEPECVSAYGTTACGFNCVSAYGEVKCARTPQGSCKAAYGEVSCWDPPVPTRQQAESIAAYGEIANGYNCVSAYGEVKCSQTPQGACKAAYGEVKCWDPWVRTHRQAECIASYGEIACEISPRMSAQAVGGAVGHNPIAILIPCHRVIGKNGNLTGYAGGLDRKIELLRLEGHCY